MIVNKTGISEILKKKREKKAMSVEKDFLERIVELVKEDKELHDATVHLLQAMENLLNERADYVKTKRLSINKHSLEMYMNIRIGILDYGIELWKWGITFNCYNLKTGKLWVWPIGIQCKDTKI